MSLRTQIIQTLKLYKNGEYNTKAFCDTFIELYYFEPSARLCFYGEERQALDELATAAECFSTCEEDIETYPDTYTTEKQVRAKYYNVEKLLKI